VLVLPQYCFFSDDTMLFYVSSTAGTPLQGDIPNIKNPIHKGILYIFYRLKKTDAVTKHPCSVSPVFSVQGNDTPCTR